MNKYKDFFKRAINPKNWKSLIIEYRELVLYIVFGALTTLVSIASYFIFRNLFPDEASAPDFLKWTYHISMGSDIDSSTVLPNIISWILSVTFAFVTNKIWVFQSKVKGFGKVTKEVLSFYTARLLTLFVDLIIMFLLVNLPNIQNGFYEFCAKVFSNIVVLVLNYVFSKVFIFKKKK